MKRWFSKWFTKVDPDVLEVVDTFEQCRMRVLHLTLQTGKGYHATARQDGRWEVREW